MMNVYDMVNEKVINALADGVVPWRKPWAGGGLPVNYLTGRAYRGVNSFLLGLSHYEAPFYLTFRQVQQCGGRLRKGAVSDPVVFWSWMHKKNEEGVTETFPLLRYYRVFNVEETIGIDYRSRLTRMESFEAIAACEEVIGGFMSPPGIVHGGAEAFYQRARDVVCMPHKVSFDSEELYYSTLFHELVHSTGHAKRLNRKTLEV